MHRETQAKPLVDWLGRVFGDWKPNPEEVKLWIDLVEPLDYALAERAITAMKRAIAYSKPNMPEFSKQLQIIAQGNVIRRGPPVPTVFIQCVEAEPSFPLRLGMHVPVYYGNGDAAHELRIAGDAARLHAEMYGGKWAIYQGTTPYAMQARRCELLAHAGLLVKKAKANDGAVRREIERLAPTQKPSKPYVPPPTGDEIPF